MHQPLNISSKAWYCSVYWNNRCCD